jgi:hypothetical protein
MCCVVSLKLRMPKSWTDEAKVLLLNEMIRQRVRPAELARRLQTTPQEVNRLTNSKAVAAKNATISIENRLTEREVESTSSRVSAWKTGSSGSME